MDRVHIQLFHQDRWHDAFTIAVRDASKGHRGPTMSDYDITYAIDQEIDLDDTVIDQRAVSVALPVTLAALHRRAWPAFLLDLLPQGRARTLLADWLGLPDTDAADLPILLRTGAQPIGNLRVRDALDHRLPSLADESAMPPNRSLTLDQIASHSDDFAEVLAAHAAGAAGSSGVQGVWPKLLLTSSTEDGTFWPDSLLPDALARRHYIAKTTAAGADDVTRLILRSEPGYLEVARACGLRCGDPILWVDGTLLIPRFDRAVTPAGVQRHGQESLVSAIGISAFGHMERHETYLDLLKRTCTDPAVEVIEYVRREMLAIAMGDTDNHGRNTALQKRDGRVALTPLFDFAPMRLDRGVIIPSTRWAFGRWLTRPEHVDHVCEQTADNTTLHPDDVRRALARMAPLLRALPDLARRHGVPEPVASRAINGNDLADLFEKS